MTTLQETRLAHQIMIVDSMGEVPKFSSILADNIKSFRASYPHAAYRLWDGNSLRNFIKEKFGLVVQKAFDMLAPYSYKADLARFCILYEYGGIYADIGMRCINPLRPPAHVGIASFRDKDFLSPSWTAIAGGITWAIPRREEFRIAIQ